MDENNVPENVLEAVKDGVMHIENALPNTEVFYRADGQEALIISGFQLITVDSEGNFSSAHTGVWSTGVDI